MKLTELDPRWFAEPGRHGQGFTFVCPLCREMRLGVPFANPVDGGPPLPPSMRGSKNGCLWTRVGGGFETLTISPSIDASRVERPDGMSDERWAQVNRPCREGGWSCWHGWIQGGEAR